MSPVLAVVISIVVLIVGIAIGYILRKNVGEKAITLMDDDTILFLPGKGRETREKRGIRYIDTPSDADVVIEYMK